MFDKNEKPFPYDGKKYLVYDKETGDYSILNCPNENYLPGVWDIIDGEWRGRSTFFSFTHWSPLPEVK